MPHLKMEGTHRPDAEGAEHTQKNPVPQQTLENRPQVQ